MARRPVNPPARGWSLTLRPRDWARLEQHLFSDGEEHGAVVLAERVDGPRGPRLLATQILLAEDGVDYVAGTHGHRALTAAFVRDAALRARAGRLAYIAFHNHGGSTRVGFSNVDLDSHERGYPAIRQITGHTVGAVVCTPQAAAGDLWLPDGTRALLAELVVPGPQLRRLRPEPARPPVGGPAAFDRQARLFGDLGQATFREMTVAIVGLGGVGSIVAEYLARVGIGHLILIDNDTVDETNLPRLVGATRRDIGKPKVKLARRNIRRANPHSKVTLQRSAVQDPDALRLLAMADWIFLAADTHAARHWVNAIVEAHLIPATQLGVKVPVNTDGEIGRIHAAYRRMIPGYGCFWCNGLINPAELAIDMAPDTEREQAQYVENVPAASVITLNGITAAQATTDFLLAITDLSAYAAMHHFEFVRERTAISTVPRRDADCGWCGDSDEAGLRCQLAARLTATPRAVPVNWDRRLLDLFRRGRSPGNRHTA
ncbi:ThiF family adenylyltransferase [Nocardioides sp. NBC_00368]|uniref:ThiF family adenylyltransferase n=1 Tax=Nocardioides sp. NBC_00368 TaxID=2976000 RepID=UPI002E1DFC8D